MRVQVARMRPHGGHLLISMARLLQRCYVNMYLWAAQPQRVLAALPAIANGLQAASSPFTVATKSRLIAAKPFRCSTAGIPSVPCPVMLDQPFQAARLVEAGVACKPLPFYQISAAVSLA
jgi:hypothetical protein